MLLHFPEVPISKREPCFPRQLWNSVSVLLHADSHPIWRLHIYVVRQLAMSGTWVGDLEARSSSQVLSCFLACLANHRFKGLLRTYVYRVVSW
jgi:hypothetical protein